METRGLKAVEGQYPVQDGDIVPVSNEFVSLLEGQKYANLPAKRVGIVITYVLLKQSRIAYYQHDILAKNEFPVSAFCLP